MSSRPNNGHALYQDLLEKHIAGLPLLPGDRIALFDHLENCHNCRIMLEAEERVTARMKAVPKLVPPSDLRAKILSQALRDHRERTTTPSEDPNVSDLLRPREPNQPVAESAVSVPRPPAGNRTANLQTVAQPTEDLPVFAGITRPKVSPARLAWRRSSPIIAMVFLGTASIGALYTGQFQGIPLAADAQKFVWSAIDRATGKAPLPEETPKVLANSTPLLFPPDTASEIIQSKTQLLLEAAAQVEPQPEAKPLPGTGHLIHTVQSARSAIRSLNSTAEALARAAEIPIPAPAENSAPQIAALILRPTDLPASSGGFQQSELAEALESMATSHPGGRLAEKDQFAQGGHRYRLYTMELPAGSTTQIMENLTPYQSPEDRQIVTTLSTQNLVVPTANRPVRFFSSNGQHLRSALQSLPTAGVQPAREMIRFVVVE